MVLEKKNSERYLFGNRGVNGIDGTLGTALGMAHQTSTPNYLLSELAFLHDSNALLFAFEQLKRELNRFRNQ